MSHSKSTRAGRGSLHWLPPPWLDCGWGPGKGTPRGRLLAYNGSQMPRAELWCSPVLKHLGLGFFILFCMGRRTESVCMGLRSQADSLALNKALNPNVNFPQCACVWSYLPLCPVALNSLLEGFLYLPFFRLQRVWYSWPYTLPIQEWGREAGYVSPVFLSMVGTKLENLGILVPNSRIIIAGPVQ